VKFNKQSGLPIAINSSQFQTNHNLGPSNSRSRTSHVGSFVRHLLALESKITGMTHVLTINYTSISAFAANFVLIYG